MKRLHVGSPALHLVGPAAFAAMALSACAAPAPAGSEATEGKVPAEAAVAQPKAATVAALQRKGLAGEYRYHSAEQTRVRFPVLRKGLRVEERHFDPNLPTNKFRHLITLSTPGGGTVTIKVWDNPEGLDLKAWFDHNLGFLADEGTKTTTREMTAARVPGLFVEPAPDASEPETDAVFALADQIYCVTAYGSPSDQATMAMFERVVDQLEPEAQK